MGSAAFSAFGCSVLAQISGKQDEQERLVKYGYKWGSKFVDAHQAGVVNKEDIDSGLPMGMLVLWGPSTDFILGRAYQVAADAVGEKVYGNSPYSDSRLVADLEFTDRNCKLIGK
jgi:hypothetical protein